MSRSGTGAPSDPIDVVVMQRFGMATCSNGDVEELLWAQKRTGAKLIYDLDDNLLDAHPDADVEALIAPLRRRVRLLLREADHVTVSTVPLYERIENFQRNISLIPNVLDERRLQRTPPPLVENNELRIGYFGTFTHLRDLMSIIGPLRAALRALPRRPVFVMCGISHDPRILGLLDGLVTLEVQPPTGDYPSFLDAMLSQQPWDIGLAPLADGRFESTKSDIKFLEYAAFGIPGVYSDHPAYTAVEHGVTGMVAGTDGWPGCIAALAGDPALRTRIVAASREYLFAQRPLARSSRSFAAILNQLLPEHQ